VASTSNLFCNGAVGFIGWLGPVRLIIAQLMLMRGADVRCNFLRSEDTNRSIAAENIDIIADEADGAGGGVIPASAFAAFGANSFTPFFMRKLLHNGNDALKACTVASPPLLLFEIAPVLVRFDHVASHVYHLYLLLADSW
jgi:hypothetical protein